MHTASLWKALLLIVGMEIDVYANHQSGCQCALYNGLFLLLQF